MGLDQYAWAEKDGVRDEISVWRKHPNLEGWMSNLWANKGYPNAHKDNPTEFNCIDLELTREDINNLENDIINDRLPATVGFFFGNNSNDYYKQTDLEFIESAKRAIDNGSKVYYSSWW